MKKLVLFSFAAIVLSICSVDAFAAVPVHVEVNFDLARPKKNCERGIWICHIKVGANVDLSNILRGVGAKGEYDRSTGDLVLHFTTTLPADAHQEGYFFAEQGEEVLLPDEINQAIGKKVQIIPGKYKIDFTDGENGSVTVSTSVVR